MYSKIVRRTVHRGKKIPPPSASVSFTPLVQEVVSLSSLCLIVYFFFHCLSYMDSSMIHQVNLVSQFDFLLLRQYFYIMNIFVLSS